MARAVLPERPALDGLRTVALLAVFAFHAATTTVATGGFLGIDLFFVLSGFLITSLLVLERGDSGRVDFAGFWRRRIRRLAPALGLLLPVVLVATAAWYGADAYHRTSVEAVGAFAYVINWQILAHGSEGGFAFPTALQHTWTIAVEAQFYLVWPLVVLGVSALARATDHRRVARALLITSLASAALLTALRLVLHSGTESITRAYYGTDLHSTPLLAGAALGCAWLLWGPPTRRATRVALEVAGLAGLAVVLVYTFTVRRDMAWLHEGGDVAFTLASVALVAAAASPGRFLLAPALAFWPVRQLGRISYGVYLWHWPILLYLGSDRLFGLTGWALLAAQFAITLAIATASYRWLELPVRRGEWPFAQRAAAAWLGPAAALVAMGALLVMAQGMRLLADPGRPLASRPNVAAVLVWFLAALLGGTAWWLVRARTRARFATSTTTGRTGTRTGADTRESTSEGTGTTDGPAGRDDTPRRDRIAVVVAAVVTPLVLLWPVTGHPADRFAGILDAPYNAWLGWRIAEAWRHGTILVTTIPDAVWPVGVNMLLLDGLLPAHVTAVADLLTGNVFLAYNLALAIGIGLNVWAAARLASVFTDRLAVRLVAGLAFATLPALAGAYQAHLTFTWAFTLPLLLRHAVLIARGTERPPIGRLAALLVASYLCSVYHLLFGALAFAIVLAAWPGVAARWRTPAARAGAARLLAALAVTVLVLAPFLVARFRHDTAERAAGAPTAARVVEANALSADSYGIITPQQDRALDTAVWPQDDLGEIYLAALRPSFAGFVLLAGAGLAVLAASRGRRALAAAAAALFLLSLGPSLRFAGGFLVTDPAGLPRSWLPYRALLSMPGLGALRAPTRVSYALGAVLVALLALGLDALLARAPTRRWGGAALGVIAALVACTVTLPMPSSDLGLTPALRDGLGEVARRAGPDDAVLVVPTGCRADDPRVVAWQTVHGAPSVGCNVSTAAIDWYSGLQPWFTSSGLAALRCDPTRIDQRPAPFGPGAPLDAPARANLRRDLGARFLVVDRAGADATRCPGVARALEDLAEAGGGQTIAEDDDWRVIDLGPA